MKKIIIILVLSVITITSCDDNITDLNKSPYLAENVPAGSLFANAQKNTADNLASTNVNLNIFKMLAQHWTETTYTDESNYDLTTRSIPDNWWDAFYTDVIKDLQEGKRVTQADADPRITEEFKRNRIAMMDILEVYAWSVLVNTYGNIPYSKAMDINNLLPGYDDAKTIHMDLVARLDTDMDNLGGDLGPNFADYDLIYGGDIDSWMLFANSLKLRLGMTIADEDPAAAQTIVEEAAADPLISSNEENTTFEYLSATPNTNPLYVSLVLSGRKDFVVAGTFTQVMNDLNDPRRSAYFTMVNDTTPGNEDEKVYLGGGYGDSNNYSTYSKPGDFSIDPTTSQLLCSYSEVQFYLAEAAARGWTVAGTAEEFYNEAITASMEYWGVAAADIDAYLAQPEVAYTTAPGTFKEKIGLQKWIALNNRGWLAWTEWRRLDAPNLVAPPDAVSGIPVRYTYPVSEQNLNTTNYNSAAEAIGGDDVENRLFWDMN